ncbi:MAG: alpha/beta fold hydrolase [Cyanobacteria bacterium SZAS LIN-3]|nr:alpha/beta fold hydrolase [Cyanobacteria bacterium SZAS LIN-3]MBS2005614.1 alpha/beta fold hydrolase [Cyanobacteria bacterium SZAS TMP-1]
MKIPTRRIFQTIAAALLLLANPVAVFADEAHGVANLPGYKLWSDPSVRPAAAMLCIHGLGLNSGAYSEFGTRMARKGVLVYAIDVRGFGAWMKTKDGEKLDFEGTLDDIKQTLTAIHTQYPGMPVFLLGESMGGAIVLKACSQYPELIDGLISSAPGGSRYKEGRTDLEVGLHALRPRHQFDIGRGIIEQATKNPALRKLWTNDPLNRADLSAAQLIKFQLFMDGNDAAVSKITNTPVLVLQGTMDRLVKPDDTWKIFTNLLTPRKTLIALRSEHLVLEYDSVKSDAYDARTTDLVANWMHGTATQATEYDDSTAQ